MPNRKCWVIMFLPYTKELRHHFLLFFMWLTLSSDHFHGSWPCCYVVWFLVPCFNDFQFLNVLLYVIVAVIPSMSCFLLSIILQTDLVPYFWFHSQCLGLGLLWTQGLGSVRPYSGWVSVNNVSFPLKLWHRPKLFQVKYECLAHLEFLDQELFYLKWF